ncbi:TPA: hypothetical protein ACSPOE_004011 [Klebsiella pneumoniae]|uniref:hypothetical protein n=1 Tax=Klebsiella pneumoniae TaxID=573 RepID=UPI0020CEF809|nr:hypothetical protein [Klebsiella pneumoniae]MCQ1032854.1 hypothetical protein [Klebsiella pneumoniae]
MKNLSALEAVLDYDKPSRRFLDELNENQMKDLSGEIFAKLYWSKRNPQWYEKDTNLIRTANTGHATKQHSLVRSFLD